MQKEDSFNINDLVIIFCAAAWVGSITSISNNKEFPMHVGVMALMGATFCLVPIEYHASKFWDLISKRYTPESHSVIPERDSAILTLLDTFRIFLLSLTFIYIRIPVQEICGKGASDAELSSYLFMIGLYLIIGFFWNRLALDTRSADESGKFSTSKVYGKYDKFFDNYRKSEEFKRNCDSPWVDLSLGGRAVINIKFSTVTEYFRSANLFVHGAIYPFLGVIVVIFCSSVYFSSVAKMKDVDLLLELLPSLTVLVTFVFFLSQLLSKVLQIIMLTALIDSSSKKA